LWTEYVRPGYRAFMARTSKGHIQQLPSGSFRVKAAAIVIPSQLDGLRKKERLRELYRQHMPPSGADELAVLASVIGPQAGLDEPTNLAWLTEFASPD
jgi:hypothetical protein